MEVKTIGVIGAGAMGRGIAYLSLVGGYRTVLEDVSPTMVEQGSAYIKRAFEVALARGTLTLDQRDAALANFSTLNRADELCREADLLIETVPEEMEGKLEIFTIFDKFAKPGAILASNSSSLSITEMAAITFRTEDCVGMRFVDPVLVSKRLEVVRGVETSEATVATCVEVGRRMGKDIVMVRESPEFLTNPGMNGSTREKGRAR
jgi:3-hydroxybutyryl-CoA dehydrogenase